MIMGAANCRRRGSEPATRTPFKGVGTPSLRISVESLHVDVNRGIWRQYVRCVAQNEAL